MRILAVSHRLAYYGHLLERLLVFVFVFNYILLILNTLLGSYWKVKKDFSYFMFCQLYGVFKTVFN